MKKGIVFFSLSFLFLFIPNLKADHTMQTIVKIMGPDYLDNMGTVVTGLGDLNHDGFDDVGVTVPGKGKTYVYYGGNPMDTIPDLKLKGHWCISSAGDVNGDGYSDVITSDLHYCYIFLGSQTGLDTVPAVILPSEYPGDDFGSWLVNTGDVNKDGYDDILILAPNYPNGNSFGKAYVYFGGNPMDTIPDWQVTGGSGAAGSGQRRLQTVCSLDFNGDGWVDIIVGREGYYYAGNDSLPAKVDVFFGKQSGFDTIPNLVINPPPGLNYLQMAEFGGWWVSNLGDVNQDGYQDLGILLEFICGHPYIYFGGNPPDTLPALELGDGSSRSDNFIYAGDVNKDGFPDVVNGNICWGMDWGSIEVYLGSANFNGTKDKWVMADDLPPDFIEDFGRSVACARDVNGDGVDDIIASSDNFFVETNHRGEVFIFAGDSSIIAGVNDRDSEETGHPDKFLLSQNYPNPFNSVTNIQFTISGGQSPNPVSIKIYNLSGQLVRVQVNEVMKPGTYTVTWDGKNNSGKEVASGIYFYQFRTRNFQQTKRMLMIK